MSFTLIESEVARTSKELPLITIAIPTWNRATLLSQQLYQLRPYLTSEIEVVICDNASSDDTWDMLRVLVQETTHRLRCMRNGVNLGADVNYLRAIELAAGHWTWLVGDDDPIDFGVVPLLFDVLNTARSKVVLLLDRSSPTDEPIREHILIDEFFGRARDELGMMILHVGRVLCKTAAVHPMLGLAHAEAGGNLHSYGRLYGRIAAEEGVEVVRLSLLRDRNEQPPRWNLLRGHLGAWDASLTMYGDHRALAQARETRLRRKSVLQIVLERLLRGHELSRVDIFRIGRRLGWRDRLVLYGYLIAFKTMPRTAGRLLRWAKPDFVAKIQLTRERQSEDY